MLNNSCPVKCWNPVNRRNEPSEPERASMCSTSNGERCVTPAGDSTSTRAKRSSKVEDLFAKGLLIIVHRHQSLAVNVWSSWISRHRTINENILLTLFFLLLLRSRPNFRSRRGKEPIQSMIGMPVFIVLFPMMLLVFTFPDKHMKMADRAHTRLAVISEHLNAGKLPSKTPDICPTSASDLDNDSLVVSNDLLTKEQVDFYNKNGYLVVRNLVPQYLLSRYLERFQQICDGTVRVPGLTVMKDVVYAKSKHPSDERTINKIQNFEEDEVLFSYCELPQIVKYVACFTGPDIKSVHTMLINKPPDSGTMTSRHPLHQDLHYFPFRPASRMVCSWTAMEKVDTQNGCLVVLPGTHYSPLLQHYYPKWEVRELLFNLLLVTGPEFCRWHKLLWLPSLGIMFII